MRSSRPSSLVACSSTASGMPASAIFVRYSSTTEAESSPSSRWIDSICLRRKYSRCCLSAPDSRTSSRILLAQLQLGQPLALELDGELEPLGDVERLERPGPCPRRRRRARSRSCRPAGRARRSRAGTRRRARRRRAARGSPRRSRGTRARGCGCGRRRGRRRATRSPRCGGGRRGRCARRRRRRGRRRRAGRRGRRRAGGCGR